MGMASGESDVYFGTDVGKWGAEGNFFFWLAEGGQFFFPYPLVCTQNAQIFVEISNMREKHDEKFRPPDPTSKSAFGCWPIHLSLVTCHSGWGRGGGWGGRGRYALHWCVQFSFCAFSARQTLFIT